MIQLDSIAKYTYASGIYPTEIRTYHKSGGVTITKKFVWDFAKDLPLGERYPKGYIGPIAHMMRSAE